MLHKITEAIAHADHTVTITWADGVQRMTLLRGGLGVTWPNEVDFSADGLRTDAFPSTELVNATELPVD